MASPLTRFLVKVFAWLPLAFAAWYFAAPVLLWPVKLLLELVARFGFADIVKAVEQTAANFTFVTLLKPGDVTGKTAELVVDVDGLLYSFGLPLFAALVIAARTPRWLRILATGYAVMLPFIAFGVFADFLKDIAIRRRPARGVADRIRALAARGDRVLLSDRGADPADNRAGRCLAADTPGISRTDAPGKVSASPIGAHRISKHSEKASQKRREQTRAPHLPNAGPQRAPR